MYLASISVGVGEFLTISFTLADKIFALTHPISPPLIADSETLNLIAAFSNPKLLTCETHWYTDMSDILSDYQSNKIHTHTPIWIKLDIPVQTLNSEKQAKDLTKPLEIRINLKGDKKYFFNDSYMVIKNNKEQSANYFYRTTPGRVLMNKLIHSV